MDSSSATEKKSVRYRGGGHKIQGSRLTMGPWAHLDDETRERYEAIEERVKDKVRRGLL